MLAEADELRINAVNPCTKLLSTLLTMEQNGVAGDIDGAAGASSIPTGSAVAVSFFPPRLSSLLELLVRVIGSFSSEAFLISSSSCFSRFLQVEEGEGKEKEEEEEEEEEVERGEGERKEVGEGEEWGEGERREGRGKGRMRRGGREWREGRRGEGEGEREKDGGEGGEREGEKRGIREKRD